MHSELVHTRTGFTHDRIQTATEICRSIRDPQASVPWRSFHQREDRTAGSDFHHHRSKVASEIAAAERLQGQVFAHR